MGVGDVLCIMETFKPTETSVLVEQQAARIQELEQELWIVRKQRFQGREMDVILHRRTAAMQFFRKEYERRQNAPSMCQCLNSQSGGYDDVDSA